MKFRTEVNLSESNQKINHKHRLIGLGSCFVDSIGQKLKLYKFQLLQNPFGTLYHPLAIENALSRIHSMTFYTQDEIFHHNDVYFSWDHHTNFDGISVNATLNKINSSLEIAGEYARNSDFFFLTFGSSWAYELKGAEIIVANCHKVPGHHFEKILLQNAQIQNSLRTIYRLIFDLNPQATIITTISPVRHTKDGMVENTLSKARLINALHEINGEFENVSYFPSYELLMDDLRDYRFYKEDLIHPNDAALSYIWEKFSDAYFDEITKEKMKLVQKVQASINHRPFNTQTTSYKQFIYQSLKNIEIIQNQFPKGSFSQESTTLNNLMKNAD